MAALAPFPGFGLLPPLIKALSKAFPRKDEILSHTLIADNKSRVGIPALQALFHVIDTDESGALSKDELFDYAKASIEQAWGELDMDLQELLDETIRTRLNEIDLGLRSDGDISATEWVHAMMLQGSAPSHVAQELLNTRLRRILRSQPDTLDRWQGAFAAADPHGCGRLEQSAWVEVFQSLGVEPLDQARVDLEKPRTIDYFEFISHTLGTEHCDVELAVYDVSNGFGRYIPSILTSWHKFEGIWHTGIRVFGREFWFGGNIFEQKPGDTPFGKETRVVYLGKTLRTYSELVCFIVQDLKMEYSFSSYDAFEHNCNCFSNELSRFLLNGKEIPEAIRMQPAWVTRGLFVRALRPLLNKMLGQFGAADGHVCQQRVDDLTNEWRERLEAGDFVRHRACFVDAPRVVKVEALSRGSEGHLCADLVFLGCAPTQCDAKADVGRCTSSGSNGSGKDVDPWAWQVVRRKSIPVRELHPPSMRLRVGPKSRGHSYDVLRRRSKDVGKPTCRLGHILHIANHVPFLRVPPCGICGYAERASCAVCVGSREAERLSCGKCSFEMCASCCVEGRSLGGDGGVFADFLTPQLASALIKQPRWLEYKASVYFHRADYDWDGLLEDEEFRCLTDRLCWELDLEPLEKKDYENEFQRCRYTGGKSPQKSFEHFFLATLYRAAP